MTAEQLEKLLQHRTTSFFMRCGLLASGFAGLAVLVWSVANRQPDAIEYWWWSVFVFSSFFAAVVYQTDWRASGIAFAALAVGFASQLVFTDPKWFQVIDLTRTRNFHYLAQGALLGQLAVGLALVFLKAPNIKRADLLRWAANPKSLAIIILLLLFSASYMKYAPTGQFGAFAGQTVLASGFLALNTLSAVALLLSVPTKLGARMDDLVTTLLGASNEASSFQRYERVFVRGCALWLLLASVAVSLFAFERVPHTSDELVYIFQAKTLIAGHLWAPMPVAPEAFQVELLGMQDGRWFAITPFGWPLVLSIGVFFNLAWLVNPVLAALSVLIAHKLFSKAAGPVVANFVVLFMAVSPWYIAMSASYMTHTVTVVCVLAAWWSLQLAKERSPLVFGFFAGCAMGYVFLVRPLDGFVLGGLTGFWLLFEAYRDRKLATVISYGAGCVLVGVSMFAFNVAITGDPMLTPLNDYLNRLWYEGANRIGFGSDVGPAETWGQIDPFVGHSPLEGMVNFQHNMFITNLELLGFGLAAIMFVLIALLWGRRSPIDKAMTIVVVVSLLAYSLYWFSGGFYIGARYWFLVFVPLIYLSARGIAVLMERAGDNQWTHVTPESIAVTVLALCFISQVCFLPWRSLGRYHEFADHHPEYRLLTKRYDLKNSVVFFKSTLNGDILSAQFLNSPFLDGNDPIFAKDLGPATNAKVLEAFPGRKAFYVNGRTQHGGHVGLSVESLTPEER